MKKIILGAAVAFAAIFGGYTASQTSEMAMSELQIENLEMLAEAENSHLDCKYNEESECVWLHPTDSKLDERQDKAEWK